MTAPILSGASRGQSVGRLRGAWLSRWGPATALLLVAAFLTRVPGLIRPWFERDEAYIGVQAEALLRGQQLYVDVIDRKPPLAPVLYAVVAGVFGTDFRPIRVLLVLWIAATAILLVALIVAVGSSRRAAVTGGVLYVLGTVAFMPRDGQAANFELRAVLPSVLAVLVAVRAGPTARRSYAFALAARSSGSRRASSSRSSPPSFRSGSSRRAGHDPCDLSSPVGLGSCFRCLRSARPSAWQG